VQNASLLAPQAALDSRQSTLKQEAKLRPPHEAAALLAERW
jgi:hypothetical protein